MMKWEYTTVMAEFLMTGATHRLNKLGNEGWELVGFDYGFAFFKRPSEKYLKQEQKREQQLIHDACKRGR